METNHYTSRKTLRSRAALLLALVLIAGGLLSVAHLPSGKLAAAGNAAGNTYTTTCDVTVSGAAITCGVSNAAPALGAPVTYTASGGNAPYTWSPTDPSMCGSSTGTTDTCTFTAQGNYTMSVTSSGSTVSCPAVAAGTTGTITANPDRVKSGQQSALTWSQVGCDPAAVTVTGTNGFSSALAAGTAVPTGAITAQTVFTLSCVNTKLGTAIVNLVPAFQEF